ncbi:MAG: hypothetical protein GTO45_14305 [Candidatus Aminicenantes bacterium]|nr:hypothetical protein [Candidatus Aminicenantes bacterium]NIM79938.1 hypothetical protein [Candidatus Aminicenantes bacterium]NIN19277.1 hypothetical protein [Candidatus Aminicenantes bacterium]NIN43180.1 hypothetical protein [Candidatus Aminicenantes bacterium]NIN85919.1 hypothetical protein [Candidatus Aminicenantes bacterium]
MTKKSRSLAIFVFIAILAGTGCKFNNDHDNMNDDFPLLTLSYSTYWGGTDGLTEGKAVAVDREGYIYIAGDTHCTDFPLKNPLIANKSGGSMAFITRFSPDGQSIVFSTYLGGNGYDHCFDMILDNQGNIIVVGGTDSDNFPLKNNLHSAIYPPNLPAV